VFNVCYIEQTVVVFQIAHDYELLIIEDDPYYFLQFNKVMKLITMLCSWDWQFICLKPPVNWSCDVHLEVKREDCQNCPVLFCTAVLHNDMHTREQFF